MHPARLVIVGGLPGAGKTTRAIELADRFGAVRLSPDDWLERLGIDIWDEGARSRTERIQADLTVDLLRIGASVIIEWGTWMRSEREALRDSARRAGALVHLEFMDAPLDVLWERVRSRGREQEVGARAITRDDLVIWSDRVERPGDDELVGYDPLPPVVAGERPGSAGYPYGNCLPRSRVR